LQDGKALTMPVTDDDEQIFPICLTKLISKDNFDSLLYLSSTDNGLSKVTVENATKDKVAQRIPGRDITIIDEVPVSLSESVIEIFVRSKKESESLSSSLASFSLSSSKICVSDTSVPTQTSLSFLEGINDGTPDGLELGIFEGIELGNLEGINDGTPDGLELGIFEGIELGTLILSEVNAARSYNDDPRQRKDSNYLHHNARNDRLRIVAVDGQKKIVYTKR